MTIYQFDAYRFDADTLTLHHGTTPVVLRPKPAVLLRLLVQERAHIVSKTQIAATVWGTLHVQDQSLFQAICELRKVLHPHDAIVTHPNLGYQWTLPTTTARARRRPVLAAAALVTAGLVGLALLHTQAPRVGPHELLSQALPSALHAFSQGLDKLRAGDAVAAERLFRLALQENPQFAEARLMVSEALLAQGATESARALASGLVKQADVSADPYVTVAAMALLSRTEQQAGDALSALEWALAAADQARESGFVCAASDIDDRIAALVVAVRPDTPAEALSAAAVPDRCRQMRPAAGPSSAADELDSCLSPAQPRLAGEHKKSDLATA